MTRGINWDNPEYPGVVEVFVPAWVELPHGFAHYLETFNQRLGRRPKGWRGALDGGRGIEAETRGG